MEVKKLKLGESKCKHIHVGKTEKLCPVLKVHGKNMSKCEVEKYLGDLVASDCKNKSNISNRRALGIGIISQIMILLDEISFGQYYFEIAVMLRQAMLINSILFNAEVWYGVSDKEVADLEEVDELLLRKILNAHSKTPKEALYLELGCLPIRFILMSRRIMFLHYLLSLDKDQLLAKFFAAQSKFPVKNDWCLTVQENLKEIKLTLSKDEIKRKSTESFKKIVKKEVGLLAFKTLMSIKDKHSKMKDLNYSNLELQNYLQLPIITKEKAQHLFRFRTRMANFKSNFKNGNTEILCPSPGCVEEDSQQHLLSCVFLNSEYPALGLSNFKYENIFSSDVTKNKETIVIIMKAMEKRVYFEV
jgi:hypothetical protein